ncbi:hypothetical protein [Chitinimonas sp. BJYL2]|uniref:hypothetical protein n=1 Tax=Chitinimonas sp. BJYL2 TaxID=2976696 RepID=UPI0022B2EFAB|nr:hypothetical protein [Chitinimonas sp. BJYL2]
MDYVAQARFPQKHPASLLMVGLLHAGIVYGLVYGLQHGSTLVSTVLQPVTLVPDQPKPKVEPAPVKMPLPTTRVDIRIAPIDPPPIAPSVPVMPDTLPATPPATGQAAPIGQVDARPAGPPLTPSVACSNYGEIQTMLGDKLPIVADKADFAARGISQFDMLVQVLVGAHGEIKSAQVRSTTHAYASSAMQGTVLASMRRLKCAGQGVDMNMQVPLSFSLID